MEWFYNIPTPPFKCDFMMELFEIAINIDAYRAQQQGYGHPLQLFMYRKVRKEEKPHGENLPSREHKAQNLTTCLKHRCFFT